MVAEVRKPVNKLVQGLSYKSLSASLSATQYQSFLLGSCKIPFVFALHTFSFSTGKLIEWENLNEYSFN